MYIYKERDNRIGKNGNCYVLYVFHKLVNDYENCRAFITYLAQT
jgi:hypothetical protein